jgi:hypothetical protein
MSDYSRQNDFGAKDLLSTGNPDKLILGADVDEELDAVLTAVASKTDESREGAASGVATLDAGALMVGGISGTPLSGGGQLPEASETLLGAVELATTAEVNTGTDALRVITPATLDLAFEQNAGIVSDLINLGDPAQDTVLGWDDSINGAIHFGLAEGITSNVGAELILDSATMSGTGITVTAGVVAIDHLGIEDLVDAAADALMGWDDTANKTDWFAAADGLSIDNAAGTIGITDIAAGAAQPVVVTAGVISSDYSSITEISVDGLTQSADGVLMSDAGVLKVMPIDEAGIIVVNATDAIQTFALADANTLQILDSVTTRIWTIPLDSAVAFKIGTVILINCISTALVDVKADTGVTLTSVYNTDGTTATTDSVSAGGRAALIKIATDEWTISGDIAD